MHAETSQVEQYKRKLELLAEGKLVEAMHVVTGGSSATAKAVEKIGGDELEGAQERLLTCASCTLFDLCNA